jgi:heme A synthase
MVLLAVVLGAGHLAFWHSGSPWIRKLGIAAALTSASQVLLGFLSVYYGLAVAPVSLHTLLAATLLTLMVLLAASTWASTRKQP